MIYITIASMILTIIISLLTLIIAGTVAYIGYLQYQTNIKRQEVEEEKFKLDLFDKRFKVFETTRTLFFSIMTSGIEIDKLEIHEFGFKTIDAVFLFDETISEYLKEVHKKAIRLNSISIQCEDLSVGAGLDRLVKEQGEIGDWFSGEYLKLQNLFSPYLRFKTWK